MNAASAPVAMWVTTPWSGTIEVLGTTGADAAFIDLEHVSYGLAEAEHLIVSCEAAGISPIVRCSALSEVSRILDAGAHGVIFPHIEDAVQAREALATLRYAPAGSRGWGGAHTRHAMWEGGYAADFFSGRVASAGVYSQHYVETAEAGALGVLLVETVHGVESIDEIAAVPDVGAVVFGWGDYAVAVGFDAGRCRSASEAVHAACRRNGVGVSLVAGEEFYPGCFALAGVDSLHMSAALAAAVDRARSDVHAAAAR
jgi:4-hydroxy-2-oxoheptanedioate aldolase